MATKEQILDTLRRLKGNLHSRYRVNEIGLFGSAVRGEQTEFSDIDVLVEFEKGADLLDVSGLKIFLEEQFKQKVDVVSKRALRHEFRDQVLREVVQA